MDPQPLLTSSTERAERGLDSLRDANRVANETAELGTGILGQLHVQREQLTGAMERRDDMQQDLTISSRLIRRMSTRASLIKLTLCIVILVLLGAIGVIVWVKWIPHGQHQPEPPPPPLSPSPPPLLISPIAQPAAAAIVGRLLQQGEGDPALGVGIILLLAFGGGFAALAFFACAARPAKRFSVICLLCLLYTILLLVLFLLPREEFEYDRSAREGDRDGGRVTDVGVLLRALFGAFLVISALVGLVGVLVLHLAPKMRERASGEALTRPINQLPDQPIKGSN